MSTGSYKTPEGRQIVESLYNKVLSDYSPLPFEQLFIPTETARTHVLRFGDGAKPPVVLIHGSASNSAVWLGTVTEFSDRFCVYCVDIPGEPGLSEPERRPLSSDAPYRWLGSLLDGLGIDTCPFATISLGSWYALNFAARSPERVKALSMLTTGGLVPARTGFIFLALFSMMLGKAGQRLLNKAIYHNAEVPSQVLDFQAVVSKHFNPLTEPLPIFADEEIRRIEAPVQYFGGDHDALIDSVKTGERLKRLLPGAEVHILKDTGHAIIDRFSDMRKFLVSV